MPDAKPKIIVVGAGIVGAAVTILDQEGPAAGRLATGEILDGIEERPLAAWRLARFETSAVPAQGRS